MSATRRTVLAIFVLALIVYLFPLVYDLVHKPFFTWAPGQDLASTSLLPVVLLEHGDFTLNEYKGFYTEYFRSPYFIAEVNGKIVSRSPVVAAVLAVPFYGIPLGTGWLRNTGRSWLEFPWSAFFPGKFAAAFITALAAAMFFFCARELTDLRTSAAITLVFAFATSVWSTASQGLWQQTPSVLFQITGVWFLLRGNRKGADAVAPGALFFSAATASRPNDALAAILFTIYVLIRYRSAFWKWIAWAILPALLVFSYNAVYNGSPFVFGYQDGITQYFSLPSPEAVLGLLVSPSRGLLIYSPFFVLAIFGVWHVRLERERLFYWFAVTISVLNLLMIGMWYDWAGGWGFGTRLLVDVIPYATFLLIPVLVQLRGVARFAFWASVAYATILQSFGLWDYGWRWHWHWDDLAYDVWNIPESEPLFYLKQYAEMASYYLNRLVAR
jgi:hypothetical protein